MFIFFLSVYLFIRLFDCILFCQSYHLYLFLITGEKPFDSIEDLVQDGLIILYMEANNVEEYLQSARETRITRQASMMESVAGQHALGKHEEHPEEGYPNDNDEQSKNGAPASQEEDEELAGKLGGLNVTTPGDQETARDQVPPPKPARLRKHYQPCTIPLRRDCTNLSPPELDEDVVKDDEIPVSREGGESGRMAGKFEGWARSGECTYVELAL